MWGGTKTRWLLVIALGLLPVAGWGIAHALRYGRTYRDLDWTKLPSPTGIYLAEPPESTRAILDRPITYLAETSGLGTFTAIGPSRLSAQALTSPGLNTALLSDGVVHRVWGQLRVVSAVDNRSGRLRELILKIDHLDPNPSPLVEQLFPASRTAWFGWAIGGLLMSAAGRWIIQLRLWRPSWRSGWAAVSLFGALATTLLLGLSVTHHVQAAVCWKRHHLQVSAESGVLTLAFESFELSPFGESTFQFDTKRRPTADLKLLGYPTAASAYPESPSSMSLSTPIANVTLPLTYPIAALLALMFWSYRTRQGFAPGLCRSCGYDLRASPLRCPECGLVVARKSRIIGAGPKTR